MALMMTLKPKRMWAVWMLFFFQYAAIGAYYTFLNVYFRNAGLSGTSIGLLNMITALVGVGSSMVGGTSVTAPASRNG